jgi:hypothetical protein
MTKLQTLIDEYLETRMAYDEAHEISTQKHLTHQAAKAALVNEMLEREQQSVKFGDGELDGMTFYLRSVFSVSVTVNNEDKVKEWLHEHYGDVHEFTVEKVNKKSVEERLKSDIEGEQLDEFDVPEFLCLKTNPDISVTGYKQYSARRKQ